MGVMSVYGFYGCVWVSMVFYGFLSFYGYF